MDVSPTALRESAAAIAQDYPGLDVHGVVGDFTEHLDLVPGQRPRLVAFLGGTIGNLVPGERSKFLAALRSVLAEGEWLLLGTDLVKDPDVLVRAYDDSAGVTAEFDKNVLLVLNRELDANFDADAFEHVAMWDPDAQWIEMRLRATKAMRVRLAALDLDLTFERGEELRTEVSAKFTWPGVTAELAEAGFELVKWFTDPKERFAVSLARAAG
jgi:L-histidine N-alpha-methyltransferase